MIQAVGAQELPGVRQADLHRGGALEHGHHQLDVPEGGTVGAGEAEIDGALLLSRTAGGLRRRRRQSAFQRVQRVAHDLGRLLVPDGQASLYQHRGVHLHIAAALVDDPAEAQQLHGGQLILNGHIGHEGVVFGGAGAAGGDASRHGDVLAVGKVLGAVLALEIGHDGVDGYGPGPLGQRAVVLHGVTGQVQPRGVLLHAHPLHGGELRDIRQGDA